jgi:hypothetical protein
VTEDGSLEWTTLAIIIWNKGSLTRSFGKNSTALQQILGTLQPRQQELAACSSQELLREGAL